MDNVDTTALPFYNPWEGEDWYLIDVDDGTKPQPLDVDFWHYCKYTGNGDVSGEVTGNASKSQLSFMKYIISS
jgi:hypothetical protein